VIRDQESFVRATITSAATVEGLVTALAEVPKEAIIREVEVHEDYSEKEPFPVTLTVRVEWVQQ
jgi:hypothetical protein